MQFVNDTNYDKKSLSAFNRLAGQTIDSKRHRFHRILCIVFGAVGLSSGCYLQLIAQKEGILPSVSYLYGILFLFVGIFWYPFQNYISKWKLSQGIKSFHFEFDLESFRCENQLTSSNYQYQSLSSISENEHWFALFSDNKQGMILAKSGFSIGDPNDFASFLEEKTKLTIRKVK
jgi:hypothetical protein